MNIIEKLRYEAQNNQMIDNYYLPAGQLLMEAATEIEELRKLYDDPEWDATDAAHPAWFRGESYSALKAADLIKNIMSGKETGRGTMNEPIATMRETVLKLRSICEEVIKRLWDFSEINQEDDKDIIETIQKLGIKNPNELLKPKNWNIRNVI